MPPILAVCTSGAEAFFIAVVDGLPEHVCAILIDLVVAAATLVPVDRSHVEVRIMIVIVVPIVPEAYLLLT